ncbi:MAG: acyl-CoA dehydrogenase family protein [Dehalococcoidia bacterium]
MPTATLTANPLARARKIGPILRLNAAQGEKERALTAEAHEALVDAGVFSLTLPKSLGGEEVDLQTMNRVVREIARADGSAGWCAMISGVYASFGGLLPRVGAEEVFAAGGRTVIAGALGPMGQAVVVPGGYRVSGRWNFGSNSPHATWFCGGCVVINDGAPVMQPNGQMPVIKIALFPRSAVTIIDTWHTTGLGATGSHDYAVSDVFVPAERAFWFGDPPVEQGLLYQLPIVAGYGTTIANVPLGVAQHALDSFIEMAPSKTPVLSPVTLAQKANVHDRLGDAIADVDAALAYIERVVDDTWAALDAGENVSWTQRGKLWLGGTKCGELALKAIDGLYTAAGGSAVYAANDLDRCHRDARTAVQHIMTQFLNYENAGRQAFGADMRQSTWVFDYRGELE